MFPRQNVTTSGGPPACYAADEGRKSTGYEEGTGGVGGHDDGAGAAAGDGQLDGQGEQQSLRLLCYSKLRPT